MSAPVVTVREVEQLVQALQAERKEDEGWATADVLAMEIYGKNTETKKRRVRAAANSAGDGVVSYPGSPGYKLWRRCSVDELHACLASYNAQTLEMRRRRDLYRMRLHRENPASFREPVEIRPSTEQLALL